MMSEERHPVEFEVHRKRRAKCFRCNWTSEGDGAGADAPRHTEDTGHPTVFDHQESWHYRVFEEKDGR